MRTEFIGDGFRQVRTRLADFPWESTHRLTLAPFESAGGPGGTRAAPPWNIQYGFYDSNRQYRAGGAATEFVTLYWLESGRWRERPEWLSGKIFSPPQGVAAELSLENGELRKATVNGHKYEFAERSRSIDGQAWELVSSAEAPQPPPLETAPAPWKLSSPIELPMSVHAGWVQVLLGSRLAILDTGSVTSVVDRSWCEEAGWPVAGDVPLPSPMWKGGLQLTRTGPLQLLGAELGPMTMMTLRLRDSILAENLNGVQALLANDVLGQAVVQLDYPASKLRVYPRGQWQPAEGDREIEVKMQSGLPYVKVGDSHLLMDTGSGMTAFLPRSPQTAVNAGLYDEEGVVFAVGQAGGWPARTDLRVGPFHWKNAPVVAIDRGRMKGLVVDGPGVLGHGFLRHFRVTMDLAAGRVWLAQGLPFRNPRWGHFGMILERRAGRLLVRSVSRQGPAAHKGIQAGDVLLNPEMRYFYNDWPVTAGETADLVVERAGKTRKMRLRAVNW